MYEFLLFSSMTQKFVEYDMKGGRMTLLVRIWSCSKDFFFFFSFFGGLNCQNECQNWQNKKNNKYWVMLIDSLKEFVNYPF